jgi:hypothetical protein
MEEKGSGSLPEQLYTVGWVDEGPHSDDAKAKLEDAASKRHR